jgi:NAD(P)-dependent dehydrogenase (short-subunit alcohol dehydrogenase family)
MMYIMNIVVRLHGATPLLPSPPVHITNASSGIGTTHVDCFVALNTAAVARLDSAALPRLAEASDGANIYVSSLVRLTSELGMSAYSATKAFVRFLSRSLDLELGQKGVYVHAVLAMRNQGDELVGAALIRFDRREPATIPSLHDVEEWGPNRDARRAMIPAQRQAHTAERHRSGVRPI